MPVLPPVAVVACALAASASALVTWWRMTAPFSPVAVAMGTVEISPGVHMPLLANGIARDHTVWLHVLGLDRFREEEDRAHLAAQRLWPRA